MLAVKILAVDWGETRMGFAVSDETASIAFPLAVEECAGEKQRRRAVVVKMEETGAELLVVGLPLTMQGTEGESAHAVKAFAESLRTSLAAPIVLWDERMTTDIAERAARQSRPRGRRSRGKERVDAVAAAVLLQSYLDSRRKAED
jgi:putative Holliday junction resolvase